MGKCTICDGRHLRFRCLRSCRPRRSRCRRYATTKSNRSLRVSTRKMTKNSNCLHDAKTKTTKILNLSRCVMTTNSMCRCHARWMKTNRCRDSIRHPMKSLSRRGDNCRCCCRDCLPKEQQDGDWSHCLWTRHRDNIRPKEHPNRRGDNYRRREKACGVRHNCLHRAKRRDFRPSQGRVCGRSHNHGNASRACKDGNTRDRSARGDTSGHTSKGCTSNRNATTRDSRNSRGRTSASSNRIQGRSGTQKATLRNSILHKGEDLHNNYSRGLCRIR